MDVAFIEFPLASVGVVVADAVCVGGALSVYVVVVWVFDVESVMLSTGYFDFGSVT